MPNRKRPGGAAAAASASGSSRASAAAASGSAHTLNRRHPRAGRGGNGDRVTRSSKAKLTNGLEDPAQVEKELNAQLRAMNLYAANTMGDGNCLFRALSDQFYGHPGFHAMLRDGVCNYLSDKPEKFAGFVDVEKPFDEYVRSMRQNGTYGGHLELSAFAQLYQKEIKIMQPGLVYIVSPVDDTEAPSTRAERERRELERKQLQMTLRPEEEAPAPSAREQRRAMRERKASRGAMDLAPRGTANGAASGSASTSTAAGTSSQPAAAEGSQSARPEAWGPLYIAYHNWEHYSSIRNIDGPHTGLPRIRERGVAASGSGNGASSAAAEEENEPNEEEALLIASTGNELSLPLARFLIRQNGGWELALQAWQASQFGDAADADADADAIDAEVQAAGDAGVVYTGERRALPPTSSSSHLEVVNKWRGMRAGSPSSETALSSNADAASVDASTTATTALGEESSAADAAGMKVQSVAASNLAELQAAPLSSSPGPRAKRAASKAPLNDGRESKRRSRSRSRSCSPTVAAADNEPHSSSSASASSSSTGNSVGAKTSAALSRLSVATRSADSNSTSEEAASPAASSPAPPAPPVRRGPGRPRKDGQLPGTVPPPPGAPPSARQLRMAAAQKRKLRTNEERIRRAEARRAAAEAKSQQGGGAAKKEEKKTRQPGIVELHI